MRKIRRWLLASALTSTAFALLPACPSLAAPTSASWGKALSGTLSTSHSTDTYQFVVDSTTTARFVLGDLVANYDLTLTTASGDVVKKSTKSGNHFDEIIAHLPAGKYELTVSAPEAAYSIQPYHLVGSKYAKPAILSQRLVQHRTDWSYDDEATFALEFINPTSHPVAFHATADLYDSQGGYLDSVNVGTTTVALPGRKGVASFDFNPGYDQGRAVKVKLTKVSFGRMACPAAHYLAGLSNVKIVRDDADSFDFSGLVENKNRQDMDFYLDASQYDARGGIIEWAGDWLDEVPARRKVSFSGFGTYFNQDPVNTWGLTARVSWDDDFACHSA